MIAKFLIGLIIVSYSDYCLTEAFVLCRVDSYLICTPIKHCVLDVKMNISETFTATNGVKQDGVISPILFCVYMDVFFNRISQ